MGKLNIEAMRQAKVRLESQGSGGSGYGFAKLQQGKNVIRILPPKVDGGSFFSEGYVHFGLGPEGKNMVTCLKTFGDRERCPVCEYVEKLQKSRDKNDQKLADRIKRKKRVYINIISRDDDSENDEPKVLPIGVTVLKALLDIVCDLDFGDVTDFKEGRDITIKRTGQLLNTEYSVLPKPTTSVATEMYSAEELEEKLADLDSLFKRLSIEELQDMIAGEESDGDEDDTPEMKGSAKSSSSESDYDDMELEELQELCEKRGIPLPDRLTKLRLVTLLTAYDDGELDLESKPSKTTTSDDDAEDDEVIGSINAAIQARKNKN